MASFMAVIEGGGSAALPFSGKEFERLVDMICSDYAVGDEKNDVAHGGVEAYCHLKMEPAWSSRLRPWPRALRLEARA